MTQIDLSARLPVPVCERAEVAVWAHELRELFGTVGLSINRFCLLHPIDKGSVSRYLSGKRVPGDRWFLDQLFALRAAAGTPLTDEVRDHLVGLQLQALQVAHPREYKVRIVKDELDIAVTSLREQERYARDLEVQLADRNRQLAELTAANEWMRTAWNVDRIAAQNEADRLRREIADLVTQLSQARQHRDRAEARCQELEDLLDRLDVGEFEDGQKLAEQSILVQHFDTAVGHLNDAAPERRCDGVRILAQIAGVSAFYRPAVKGLLLELIGTYKLRSEIPASLPPVLLTDRSPLQAALEAIRNDLGDLKGLAHTDLRQVDLRGIDLDGADLRGANLCGTNLGNAHLRHTDLSGADLRGANLQDANLGGANLQDAYLSEADLGSANLGAADLSDANLNSTYLGSADLSGANLARAELRGANLVGADLSGAYLGDADLSHANLRCVNLDHAYLGGASLHRTYLHGANLEDAWKLYQPVLEAAQSSVTCAPVRS